MASPESRVQPGPEPGLAAGALGTKEVFFQAVTHIGPAIGIIFLVVSLPGFVGGSIGLLLTLALGASVLTALGVTALARKLPSAGGYYSYVSHGLGERAGFVTAWLYFLYDPIGPTVVVLFTARIFADLFASEGVAIPWWVIAAVLLAVLLVLPYFGVKPSARVNLALGLIECVIMIVFVISLIFHAGSHQSLAPFRMFNFSAGTQPIFQGFALTVLLFTGFEGAAPLAEETANPTRAIPRTVMASLLGVGILWIVAGYAVVVGWGAQHIGTIVTAESPAFTLAKAVWGIGWILVPFAFLNSALSAALANQNGGTRVLYALGRRGLLPRPLGRIHPRYHTPYVAIVTQSAINIALVFGLGAWLGIVNAWLLMALISTIGVICIYAMGNISVMRLFWRDYRTEFSPVRHVAVPLVANVIYLIGLYYSFVPFPAHPIDFALWFSILWVAVGIGAAVYLWNRRPDDMRLAAAVMAPGHDSITADGFAVGGSQGQLESA